MNNNPLPRRDLREPAFRKYEPFIAKACSQSYYLTPKSDPSIKCSSATFAARFRDAILAKKRYNYHSNLIPSTFDLSKIEVFEFLDGRVLIQNKTESIAPIEPVKEQGITEQTVIALMKKIASKVVLSEELTVSGVEELGRVLSWAANHKEIDCMVVAQNGNALFYTL